MTRPPRYMMTTNGFESKISTNLAEDHGEAWRSTLRKQSPQLPLPGSSARKYRSPVVEPRQLSTTGNYEDSPTNSRPPHVGCQIKDNVNMHN